MKTHDLVQGSAEWLAYRAQHFNASDAPAMMGCSPYKTRAALLREMHTGVAADVDAPTQRRFDDGHRFEALARPLSEEIIGETLYPVVGSLENLSASFDGLTLGEDTAYEHKSLNDELRALLPASGVSGPEVGARLPLMYRVQMEQQLMVSGAGRVLFMASKWDSEGNLIEARCCWYEADMALRTHIVAGWERFAADLAAYVPPTTSEPVRAETMESLPAVSVRLDGALSVAGNLPTFAEALKAFIARMPTKPATDTDFATCEAACKSLKKAEEALDAAEAGALASITDVEAMRRAVADCRKLARDTRLAAEKLVERRKVEIKEQAVAAAKAALDKHIGDLNGELAPMRLQPVAADFAGSIKGLRSIASMQDALDTTLAGGKIAADAQARVIRANVAAFKAAATGLEFLFSDLGALIHKPADDFAMLVKARVDTHRAAEARREQERQAAEAARIAAAEQRAREQEAARLAEEQRQREVEAARQAAAVVAAAAAPTPEVISPTAPTAPWPPNHPERPTAAPVFAMPKHEEAAPRADEPATLNLSAINAIFGGKIKLDAAGLALMGIEPSNRHQNARLYRESDLSRICRALVVLAAEVQELQAA